MADSSANGYKGNTPFERVVIQRLDNINGRLDEQGSALRKLRSDVQAIQAVLTNDRAQYYEMRNRMSAAGKALSGNEKN